MSSLDDLGIHVTELDSCSNNPDGNNECECDCDCQSSGDCPPAS